MDYFWSILHRKWTVVSVFLLGMGIAAFIAYTATPYYISRSVVEINKLFPRSSSVTDLFSFFNRFDLYFQTQISILESQGLAEKFLENMRAKKAGKSPSESDGPSGSPKKPETESSQGTAHKERNRQVILDEERMKSASINSVRSKVTVTPLRGTQMIEVQMGASDPLLAREMLDEYLKTFIEMSTQKRDQLGPR